MFGFSPSGLAEPPPRAASNTLSTIDELIPPTWTIVSLPLNTDLSEFSPTNANPLFFAKGDTVNASTKLSPFAKYNLFVFG